MGLFVKSGKRNVSLVGMFFCICAYLAIIMKITFEAKIYFAYYLDIIGWQRHKDLENADSFE